MRGLAVTFLAMLGLVAAAIFAAPAFAAEPICQVNSPLCTEVVDPIGEYGAYTGHDEPSLLFYSQQPGSGTNQTYQLTLPRDPKKFPTPDGLGPTWNFQLHPAFWFGMAMCDTQSAPEFQQKSCPAGSDANIFDNANPAAHDFIGHHPGTAFMEMQFYPPGWTPWPAGVSCSATQWCAALNIDSLSVSYVDATSQNSSCLDTAGIEPVSFAFITLSGVPQASPDPTTVFQPPFAATTPDPSKVQFYNPGDKLTVDIKDTFVGLRIVIRDQNTGQTGSMTTSAQNGFRQVLYEPTSSTCHTKPYTYHSMYSTSSEKTRVVWAAHSYNIAYSDEIGHFEFCNSIDAAGNCNDGGNASDPTGNDDDDAGCFSASQSLLVPIGGCLATDTDFDGPEYSAAAWPGGVANGKFESKRDGKASSTPDPVQFTSPVFNDGSQFDRVAFEADLPRIELATNPPCNRATGANCVNPPPGTSFYPMFTTAKGEDGSCVWNEGGANIPGTTNTFGGSSTTEFGPLLLLTYPSATAPGGTVQRYNDFRQVLDNNPCPSKGGRDVHH
jgi:hypothetical protein